MMELTGERTIDAPRAKVWDGLMDTGMLRAAIPGCESVTDEGNGCYSAVVVAAVGPLRARFKGKLQQQDMLPPEQYGLRFEGEGGLAGFAKGHALVTLTETGPNGSQTLLSYRAEAQIGGRLAQIGARLIDATAAKMSGQFFGRFQELLDNPGTPEAQTAAEDKPMQSSTDARTELARTVIAHSGAPVSVPANAPGVVTLQMPAWTWALTVTVIAALAAWLGVH